MHDPQAAAEVAAHPVPTIAPGPESETEEDAAPREAEHEQRMAEYQTEQQRREEERKAEFERQQKEYEAEQARRDKQRKARVSTFERIIEQAPAYFNPSQMRVFLRLLIHLDYSFLEEVASHFANGDENAQQSDEEIVWPRWTAPQTRS
jgi:ParB family chromosome partitioning protein